MFTSRDRNVASITFLGRAEAPSFRAKRLVTSTQLIWAEAPNPFLFIDADSKTRLPGYSASGRPLGGDPKAKETVTAWRAGKQMPKRVIDENQFPPFFHRRNKPGFGQVPQIFCRGQLLGDAGLLDKTDFAVGLIRAEMHAVYPLSRVNV